MVKLKGKNIFSKIGTFALAAVFFGSQTLQAIPPEEIATSESIMAQVVGGDNVAAPYMMNGESLVAMLQELISFEVPGSSVIFNRRTGQLFIKATPSNHEVIQNVLEDLRQTRRRQVEIETRIITVGITDFEGFGADFNSIEFLTDDDDADSPGDSLIFGSGTIGNNALTTPAIETLFPDLNTIFDSSGIGGAFAVGIEKANNYDIDFFIDALSRKAKVNTLAAPKITVFNNQRGNIAIKKYKFYISEVETSLETRTVGNTNVLTAAQDSEIQMAPSGTILDVTPTINSNGSITLELHPTFIKANIDNIQAIEIGVSGTGNSVTLPVYTSQEINTTVTVENGGVVVLGGLVSEEEINEHDKVPILGSIPLIGKALFQNRQKRDIKTHLLIFVKARVIQL